MCSHIRHSVEFFRFSARKTVRYGETNFGTAKQLKGNPMNGKPLIVDMDDARLVARAYNLGMKLVPNLAHVLSEEQLEY